MQVAKQTVEQPSELKDVWAANELQDIVTRNVKYFKQLIFTGVKSLRRDGRPIFTEKVAMQERLQRLLEQGPEFWSSLEQADPATAASLAMQVVSARAKGKVAQYGPLAEQAIEPDVQAAYDAANAAEQKQELNMQRQRLLPSSVRFGLNLPAVAARSSELE